MTRVLPPRVQRVADLVVSQAGGYLRNTIREHRVTCAVCAAPVDGYERCIPCSGHASSAHRTADRVASLVYAVEYDSQAYKLVRGYKADNPGPSLSDMMSSLLAIGLQGHGACDAKLAGNPADIGWAVVPSTRRPDRPQPLRVLLQALAKPGHEIVLAPSPNPVSVRELRPENFLVVTPPPYRPHVILIDDSWVRGGHAQSAAAALKLAGVADVSILTVARVLNPDWAPNVEFIRVRLGGWYDPSICPWTGGACP
ncbi:MAG: hypothetical protein IR158_16685 [Cellulomonas sp.]|uniref:hypothetical protein n=1 Tax=Cellulomonas sp. TaxID=40001 RepID=UPI0019FE0FD2|nr:hypothetical protein [Cellulomonas sp.]MBF0689389.1 hypothetical protein [Cellulomonas sp.]